MVCLVNPRATRWRYRIPLSVLNIGASLEGQFPYSILDGNLLAETYPALSAEVEHRSIRYVGFTVMPGPQLREAILLSRRLKEDFPAVTIIWGGYFPSLHADIVLRSTYVDYVIREQGEHAFPQLLHCLEHGGSLASIAGLSYKDGAIHHNAGQHLIDPNSLPSLPYHRVDMRRYIGRTYVGNRTVNYHSSVGCPFLCGFCAVASSYKARWLGLTPARIEADLRWFNGEYGVDAIEFHDNNFFTSERRTREFSERITDVGMTWWGEARPDTLYDYDDRTWLAMRRAGCKMIFMGAESGSQQVLDLMEKGGTQTPDTVVELARKMRGIGIIPEFSFVLGSPTPTVEQDIEKDIQFIKRVKSANPLAEIVLYVYSPVHFSASDLYREAQRRGFRFPDSLDDWLLPEWQLHDLHKQPVTPWLSKRSISRIRNFERVLNAAFPTLSDLKLRTTDRLTLRILGGWRYRSSLYSVPYEVVLTQRLLRYRQPEIEGF
jgi:anaerobic magnesium-protoporphyrin IX monomethyl ester cyclase